MSLELRAGRALVTLTRPDKRIRDENIAREQEVVAFPLAFFPRKHLFSLPPTDPREGGLFVTGERSECAEMKGKREEEEECLRRISLRKLGPFRSPLSSFSSAEWV